MADLGFGHKIQGLRDQDDTPNPQQKSGDELNHVYLPTTSIVCLLYVTENGSSAEIAVVGKEGIKAIALFMGGDTVPPGGANQHPAG